MKNRHQSCNDAAPGQVVAQDEKPKLPGCESFRWFYLRTMLHMNKSQLLALAKKLHSDGDSFWAVIAGRVALNDQFPFRETVALIVLGGSPLN